MNPEVEKYQQTVLYSQVASQTSTGYLCQDFEEEYDDFDAQGADDFVVSSPGGWRIHQIHLPGAYNIDCDAIAVQYAFHADDAGTPGAEVCSGSASLTSDAGGDILCELAAPCLLPASTSWLVVALRMDFEPGAQKWYWLTESLLSGHSAKWRNPGDGLATGCVDWCDLDEYPDFSFELLGTEQSAEIFADGFESGNTSAWSP